MCARSSHSIESYVETIEASTPNSIGTLLGSDEAAMTARFRKLSVFGWLIVALALVTVSVEAHAQDLEPRAFANTPVGLNFLIGGYAYAKGTVGTDASVPLED